MSTQDIAALVQFINDSTGNDFTYEPGDDTVLNRQTQETIPITEFTELYGDKEFHF